MNLVLAERPSPKEEGQRNPEENRNKTRQGIDPVQNSGVDPQLRVMNIFGDFLTAACQDNLRFPLEEDGRDICLRYKSKWE